MYNMDIESKRQELGRRLVEREIYYCVSSLISELNTLVQNASPGITDISWEEDILPLLESTDWEEAGHAAIDDAWDITDLEAMADSVGYWEEAIAKTEWSAEELYDEGDGEPPHTMDFNDWFQMMKETDSEGPAREAICDYIKETAGDWQEFCDEHDVDMDDHKIEVYEHWLVSDWLARRLAESGEVIGEVCGLTIWGRCCTGQSICLDRVIQNIAIEVWQDEWDEFMKTQEGESHGTK